MRPLVVPAAVCLRDSDAGAGEHVVEGSGELRVSVADQELHPVASVVELERQVPRLLGHPVARGMTGHTEDVDWGDHQISATTLWHHFSRVGHQGDRCNLARRGKSTNTRSPTSVRSSSMTHREKLTF
jgi:hypothetical protein